MSEKRVKWKDFLMNYLQVSNQSCNSCIAIWVGKCICLSMCVDFTFNINILVHTLHSNNCNKDPRGKNCSHGIE